MNDYFYMSFANSIDKKNDETLAESAPMLFQEKSTSFESQTIFVHQK
jgi:hypothetical protein